MPLQTSDEAIFTFSDPESAKLSTPDQWIDWLAQEIENFPEIPHNETHVVPLWMSFEKIDNSIAELLLKHDEDELSEVYEAYHAFTYQLFMEVSGFEVESIVGLTIKIALMAVAHKYDYATVENYQEILMLLLKISSRLAHEHLGSSYDDHGHFIPRTLH